ncbi:MAG TPA: hypothetical protein EYF98_10770 [Planctomycetes bacterium]|nr:hypothetical protein [Planctomycetota bacterium]
MTVTMGTYTKTFDNGVGIDGLAGNQTCWEHTSTGQFFIYDSGNPSLQPVSWQREAEAPTDDFIIGMMVEPGVTPLSTASFNDHPGGPYDTANGGDGGYEATHTGNFLPGYYPCTDMVQYSGGVNYWFFGDTPGGGGEDYFNMVLEIQPGVFSHWWTGQVNDGPTEMVSPYGGNMGCSGPWRDDSYDEWCTPHRSYRSSGTIKASFLYFPEGNSAGQIDSGSGLYKKEPVYKYNSTVYGVGATNWSVQVNGTDSYDNTGPWVCGADALSGRTMLSSIPMSFKKTYNTNISYSTSTNTSGDEWTYLGTVPGTAQVTIDRYLAGEELTLSADTWVVFPCVTRSTESGICSHPGTVTPGSFALSGQASATATGKISTGANTALEGWAYRK